MNYYRKFTEKEIRWIKKFENVMTNAPDTLFLFVGNGITIYSKKEDGERYMTKYGNVDSNATSIYINTPIESDGGDY